MALFRRDLKAGKSCGCDEVLSCFKAPVSKPVNQCCRDRGQCGTQMITNCGDEQDISALCHRAQ